jgi:WhiB family redox-sensing transcriptional regulator
MTHLGHQTHTAWADPEWMLAAACRGAGDPEIWFPDPGRPRNSTLPIALLVCGECPVRAECLHHALITDARYGIWGGATEAQRARLVGRKYARA